MKILILGAGLVGGPIAIDLAKDSEFNITLADINKDSFDRIGAKNKISAIQKDLSDSQSIKEIVKDFDFVLNAMPGFMGYNTLKAIIESNKDVVDIAFFPEDPFTLDELAKKNNVTAIMDCGVAPGMSNVLIGYVDHLLDKTETALIYVGGLPEVRQWPYEYKAVFSPLDVIEEDMRGYHKLMSDSGHQIILDTIAAWWQAILNLQGHSDNNAFELTGEAMNQDKVLEEAEIQYVKS